jgi:hypothetical protein
MKNISLQKLVTKCLGEAAVLHSACNICPQENSPSLSLWYLYLWRRREVCQIQISLICVFGKQDGTCYEPPLVLLDVWPVYLRNLIKKNWKLSLLCVCVCVCTLTKALTHFSESVHFIFISFRFKLEECKISKQVLSTSTLRWCLRCMA